MNMKRILPLFFIFTVAFLISSCAIQPIQKRLIGTWKPVKVEPIDVPGTQTQAAENVQTSKNAKNDSVSYQAKPRQLSKVEQQKERMIQSELRSTMTVNADKTAIKEYPGRTVHAKWKLKNNGTNLIVNTKETGKTITFHIQHVTDTSAVFTATSPIGKYKISYKKVKN
jgi:hypothetical protein